MSERLVGLAFSGGGIRSATFGLGVLQALKSLGLLEKIHYLSTVSGGGYIGSWLTANCARHKKWLTRETDWEESIKHLRRYSNYLSPDLGFFSADTWSMFTVWFRNALLVQATVILALACLLSVPRPLAVLFANWADVGHLRWLSILLFLFGVVGIAGNETRVSRLRALKVLRAESWALGRHRRGALVAVAWVYGVYMQFEPFAGGEIRLVAAGPIALLLVAAAFLLQPVAVRLVSVFKSEPPTQVNYTQAWVQGAVVLPMLATGFFVAAILWNQSVNVCEIADLDGYGALFRTMWRYWPFPLAIVFFSIWLLSLCGVASLKGAGSLVAMLSPFVCVLVLHALLCAIMLLHAQWTVDPVAGVHRAFVFTPALVLFAFSLTIVVLIGMLGRRSTEGIREWWSRLGAWLAIYGTAWMIIALAAVYGPDAARWVFTAALALARHDLHVDRDRWGRPARRQLRIDRRQAADEEEHEPASVPRGSGAVRLHRRPSRPRRLRRRRDRAAQHRQSVLAHDRHRVRMVERVPARVVDRAGRMRSGAAPHGAAHRRQRVQPERLLPQSPGAMLSGRIAVHEKDGSVTTLRAPQNFTGFDDADDVPLDKLAGTREGRANQAVESVAQTDSALGIVDRPHGPFHLVNCALNLGGSSDLALHTRHSASFTLSPLHCGSSY